MICTAPNRTETEQILQQNRHRKITNTRPSSGPRQWLRDRARTDVRSERWRASHTKRKLKLWPKYRCSSGYTSILVAFFFLTSRLCVKMNFEWTAYASPAYFKSCRLMHVACEANERSRQRRRDRTNKTMWLLHSAAIYTIVWSRYACIWCILKSPTAGIRTALCTSSSEIKRRWKGADGKRTTERRERMRKPERKSAKPARSASPKKITQIG